MKSGHYSSLWQRLHRAAKQKGFPLRAMFELTYRCNFHCQHCYIPQSYRKARELSTREVCGLLDQLSEQGCLYLGFTGGEPFMRSDILDILGHAKRKGFEIIIYTNASLITKRQAEKLALLHINKIDITLPAIKKGPFDRITGGAGHHKKVFQAIDVLHKKGVSLGFKTCLLRENADQMNDVQAFANSLNVPWRVDRLLSRRLDGSPEPYRYRGELSGARSSGNMFVAADPCSAGNGTGRKGKRGDLFPCGAGLSQVAITPQGALKLCVMIPYPNIPTRKSSLSVAWSRMREIAAKINSETNRACHGCDLGRYCTWCPARGWLAKKSFTDCAQENRRWAMETRDGHY